MEGIFRKFNLSNANYYENNPKEYGYLWIKKSTGEEGHIYDGKFHHSNFIYDPATQKRLIKDSANKKLIIQNDDSRSEIVDKQEIFLSDLDIRNEFKEQTAV